MERIRKVRKGLKLTQADVASKIGVSPSYINRIENGKRQPSMRVFVKIAKVLNVELSELL